MELIGSRHEQKTFNIIDYCFENNLTPVSFFIGMIGEISIYNGAINGTQILQNYNNMDHIKNISKLIVSKIKEKSLSNNPIFKLELF